MKALSARYWKWGLSILMGMGVFLFWGLGYPHALSYQEQYQLFLWTTDYFWERVGVAGGLADWLGEFVIQFYYYPWMGAAWLALLFVLLQRGVARLFPSSLYLMSFVPVVLLWWHMGNVSVLLSYVVALVLVVGVVGLVGKLGRVGKSGLLGRVGDILLIPIIYWLLGPMVWLYALLRTALQGWKWSWELLYVGVVIVLFSAFILVQWPMVMTTLSMTYFRVPMEIPVLQWLLPVVTAALVAFGRYMGEGWSLGENRPLNVNQPLEENHPLKGSLLLGGTWSGRWKWYSWQVVLLLVLGVFAYRKGYDQDVYELIWQDYQIRHEQWDQIIKRADQRVVRTTFWSNSVNLALSQKRLLADRMFDFYQSGDDALIMPRMRDLTSNLPSAEAYYRLGLVNSAQRYMFDIQESILNGKKSGRCTKRIVECMLVNGHYKPALKYIDLLRKSLFYRGWADVAWQTVTADAKTREQRINQHPMLGRLRQLRFKSNFLYSHSEKDKIFGMLFMDNHDNKMALDYFIGEMLLRGDVQGVMQYMKWAEQYGGYRQMPLGYQDAVQCIQRKGNLPGSMYGNYVRRMMQR